jgi:F-type H+-transporting ATPase subunit a
MFVFCRSSKSTKNNGITTGAGRFFEPLVLYVRDEIAIQTLVKKL